MTKNTNKVANKEIIGAFVFPKASDFEKVNSEVIVPVTAVANSEVIAVQSAPVKADLARAIFAECYKMETVPQRKDIIARAVSEAGLTKAGAATYLQNYKDKQGLSVKRTPATA